MKIKRCPVIFNNVLSAKQNANQKLLISEGNTSDQYTFLLNYEDTEIVIFKGYAMKRTFNFIILFLWRINDKY